jgi:hypothetical protein
VETVNVAVQFPFNSLAALARGEAMWRRTDPGVNAIRADKTTEAVRPLRGNIWKRVTQAE